MGLDMYLYRKSWVKTGHYYLDEHREEIKITRGGKDVDTSKIRYIIEEACYWRKANAIHRWFVDNVQKGVDDCGEYRVNEETLRDLLNICKEILDDHDKAYKLLPTQEGFFFGSTAYDEYYFSDIQHTYDALLNVLEDDASEYTYHSSW